MKKALWMALGASALFAAGCGVADVDGVLTEAEELQADRDYQLDYVPSEELGSTRQAVVHRLMVPAGNLDKIINACMDGNYIKWNCADTVNDGLGLNVACSTQVGTNHTRVDDNYCGYDGECVSFVKGVTHNNTTTSGWGKGASVFDNLAPGTVVATFFNGGSYEGHVGVFLRYVRNDAGAIIGFRIADQNWYARAVTKHTIYKSGTGTANADAYFAVLVP